MFVAEEPRKGLKIARIAVLLPFRYFYHILTQTFQVL
ncbi:hypothetical protein OKW46_000853 [Paraburkholderia sp. WSM4179]|nr:hypothetical protein [Paraburkholderia sp. WSM4177]MBB5483683.1 hypothetical protein [Paraburkholderia sp. WSM4180]MDH6146931.1 hypothetical protein [Paraburkholderia sp. WSM4179]